MPLSYAITVIGVLLLASGLPARSAQDSRPQTVPSPAGVETTRRPYNIADVENMVSTIAKDGIEFENGYITKIRKYRVDFPATPQYLDRLKGATPGFINVIKEVALKSTGTPSIVPRTTRTHPVPVPKQTGKLRVSGVPDGSELKVNEESVGPVSNGVWEGPVRVGKVTVSVSKEGYKPYNTEPVDLTEAGKNVALVKLLPKTGLLTVNCVGPLDCNIKLSDGSGGTASNGVWQKAVVLGNVTVTASKEGYDDPDPKKVEVTEAGAEVSFKLQPDSDTQADNGRKLLDLMLSALGLDSTKKSFVPLTGRGSITFYEKDKPVTWNLSLNIATPAQFDMTATKSTRSLTYVCRGQTFKEGKKQGIPPDQVRVLEANLENLALRHLYAVLQSGLSPSKLLLALTAEAKTEADQHLLASEYDLTLGSDLLPTEASVPGYRIQFGEYANVTSHAVKTSVVYPRLTTIIDVPGEKQRLEIRLDEVELWLPTGFVRLGAPVPLLADADGSAPR